MGGAGAGAGAGCVDEAQDRQFRGIRGVEGLIRGVNDVIRGVSGVLNVGIRRAVIGYVWLGGRRKGVLGDMHVIPRR
jgi:hypothetical protein